MKNDWKYQFTRTILNRGDSYFYQGRVYNLDYKSEGDTISFTANVRGSHRYRVSGELKDGMLKNVDCDCLYFSGNSYCKHIAAVAFAINYEEQIAEEREKRRKAEEEKKKWLKSRILLNQPFHINKEHYNYFDIEKITENLMIYQAEYNKAFSELAGSYEKLKTETYYLPNEPEKGLILDTSYQRSRISVTKNGIFYSECTSYGCEGAWSGFIRSREIDGKREPCIHMLKNLILLEEYLSENQVGDSTNYDAVKLMRTMHGTVIREAVTEKGENFKEVSLVPKVVADSSDLTLSFRIGKNKLYAVKSLNVLVDTYRSKGTIELGKNETIDFSSDVFDNNSMRYFRFISGCVDEMRSVADKNTSLYRYVPEVKNTIELKGANVDALYELAKESQAEYVNKLQGNKSKPLYFEECNPEVRFRLVKDTDDNGEFHGINLKGHMPLLISGVKSSYYIDEKADRVIFGKLSDETAKSLEPLVEAGISGKVSISIGRTNLSEFYYELLPMLKKNLDIEEPDAAFIEEHLPPKARLIFYLDAEQRVPVMRMESVYGEQTFSPLDLMRKGKIPDTVRDIRAEKRALEKVQQYFTSYDARKDLLHMEEDDDRIYDFLEHGLKELMALGEVQSTAAFDVLRVKQLPKVKVGVSVESDLMNLAVTSEELAPEELLEILKGYKLKKKYHRLKSGEFIKFDENVSELSAMFEVLHISPKEFVKGKIKIPAYRALYLDKMLENMNGVYASRDKHFRQLVKEFKTINESDFEVPESLADTLRPYQAYGYKWMRVVSACGFGGILADDMGLGKTLQLITVLLAESKKAAHTVSLVICPASLVYNWAEEFERFAPSLSVGIVSGSKNEREQIINGYEAYDVLVTSYDLLKRDTIYYEGKCFEYQVIDEAQYIKTHTTAAAKSVKIINSKHRLALTGTPIENRLSELWSIFDYLMPGFLYGYDVFKKEIETPIVKNADKDASDKLKKMVSPFILRRLKGDVLKDLPEKLEEIRVARFSEEQQKLYDGQVVKMKKLIGKEDDAEFNKSKIEILAELTRARQICCDPSLLFADYKGESAKRQACMELVHSAIEGEHRILLFSQFTSMLELLENDLKLENTAYYKITGATPKQERLDLVKAFNEGDVPVFLISLKAGGTGLNLTGADIVIHYDPWWNVAAQNQATDRAHRIGQTKTVCVYKLIAKNTIEEKIINMQKVKENLANDILSGDLGGISGMSRNDLLELLG